MNEPCEGNACSQNAELQMLRHFIPDSRTWPFFTVDTGLPGNFGLSMSCKSRSWRASICSPSPEKAQGSDSLGRQTISAGLADTVGLMSSWAAGEAQVRILYLVETQKLRCFFCLHTWTLETPEAAILSSLSLKSHSCSEPGLHWVPYELCSTWNTSVLEEESHSRGVCEHKTQSPIVL